MSRTKEEKLEDALGELDDIASLVEIAKADLECAETCETLEDFQAHLASSISHLTSALKELRATLISTK